MLTGKDIDLYFSQKSDIAYSGYLDPIKKNRLFRNTMFVACDRKYLTLDEQKVFDEIAALITTEAIFQINNNQIFLSPIAISSITFIFPTTISVVTQFPHNMITGDQATFNSVAGITTAPDLNSYAFPVTVINPTTFNITVISSTGIYTAETGNVVFSKLIEDYMHIYSVQCQFVEPQFYPVNATSGTSPINIYFQNPTKFRDKSMIQLSNMTNTPNANGTWYFKGITKSAGSLYQDQDLQVPSTGGVNSNVSQGTVNYIWCEYAKPKFSDRDIDPFEKSCVELPKYEVSDKFLKFFPSDRTCNQIKISYIKVPTVFIDVEDDTLDLSLFYPEKYLYFIIDVAIRLFSIPLRDQTLNEDISNEIIQNP